MSILFAILSLVLMAAFYFLPSIVAYFRKKKNYNAILVLNLLLGWTLIGWVIAMIWAMTVDEQKPQETKIV